LKQALIIFVRRPVLGKVKTRLAKTVGDIKALEIYNELLRHTHDITQILQCDRYIFYADEIVANDIWEDAIYRKKVQTGNDLGTRMKTAFEVLFDKGYQQICIIGSDCYELTTGIIRQAFDALQQQDVVIGPSADGGYYLLALSHVQPHLFINIEWSTGKVLTQTVDICIAAQLSYKLLQTLHDMDDEEDWLRHKAKSAAV